MPHSTRNQMLLKGNKIALVDIRRSASLPFAEEKPGKQAMLINKKEQLYYVVKFDSVKVS